MKLAETGSKISSGEIIRHQHALALLIVSYRIEHNDMNMEVSFVRKKGDARVLMGPSTSFPPSKLKTISGISLADDADDGSQNSTNTAATGASTSRLAKDDKIPRPANAFILYRKDHQDLMKAANPGIHNNDVCK